jgi:thiol-disulfide isomerase/thioredoxin
MIFQISRLTFALLILMCSSGAQAAIQDFVNGRMVGKSIQPAKLSFYASNPAHFDNKVVLIDFWAVWCVACRHTIPELNKFHADYADKGLVVVGMTRDEDKDIAEFVKRIPMAFHVATDVDGSFFKRLAVRAMPYAILTDRNGTVIWQGDPAELKRARIEAALAAPATAKARSAD